jgi:hypothetical protein
MANILRDLKSGYRCILLIIIVAALVSGWMLFNLKEINHLGELPEIKPPESPTADWKTYRNEKYGFEFKYPEKYILEENRDKTSISLKNSNLELTIQHSFAGYLPLEEFILKDLAYLSEDLDNFGQWLANPRLNDSPDVADFRKELINNREWLRFSDILLSKTIGGEIIFNSYTINDNRVIRITTDNQDIDRSNEFRNILSSFNFPDLKENSGVNTMKEISPDLRDNILQKMFSKEKVKNGAIKLDYPMIVTLNRVIEGHFTVSGKTEKLAIAILEGTPHAGGFYNAFLAIFDDQWNLLSSPFLTVNQIIVEAENSEEPYFSKKGYFGGDFGEFTFYPCNDDTIQILFAGGKQPNSPVTWSWVRLLKFGGGEFQTLQIIDSTSEEMKGIQVKSPEWAGSAIRIGLEENKIKIYKEGFRDNIPPEEEWNKGAGSLPDIYSHSLYWDNSLCRFSE